MLPSDPDDDDLEERQAIEMLEEIQQKVADQLTVTESALASLRETMDAREQSVGRLVMGIRAQPPWWATILMWTSFGAATALSAVQRLPVVAYTLHGVSVAAALLSLLRTNRIMREDPPSPLRRREPWPPSAKATVWAAAIVTVGAIVSAAITAISGG